MTVFVQGNPLMKHRPADEVIHYGTLLRGSICGYEGPRFESHIPAEVNCGHCRGILKKRGSL